MIQKGFFILYFLVITLSVFSQEGEVLSLQDRYLLQELETATLDELIALAESFGLSTQGSKEALTARIISALDLQSRENEPEDSLDSSDESDEPVDEHNNPLDEEAKVEDNDVPVMVTIESALQSRSIQVEEKEGNEIHLIGKVLLTVSQPDQGREHKIYADRIVFSQITDQVTASGNIQYIRTENGKTENFFGDSLTFLLKGWKGLIFNGVSQREDEQDNQVITFFFKGDQFRTGSDETFIMERATITSGNYENPSYAIKAKKIWILGPQEWGLAHGVLHIGRVPLFYLPFYYRPGNEMLLNPVAGYRDREGALIQTTTYFLGQKVSENQSFFNAGLVTDDEYTLERQGLFLFKGEKLTGNSTNDDMLKLMADYYTRLGYYGGLQGSFSRGKMSLDFLLDAGYSRSIDDNNSIYCDGDTEVRPNHSYLYGVELPFRWSTSLDFSWKELSLNLEYISDSRFDSDFHDRSENFDWLNWLLEEREEQSESERTSESSETSTFNWKLNYHYVFRPDILSPWISKINLNSVSMELTFNQKEDSELALIDQYDPGVAFFYPYVFSPQVIVNLEGTLLNYNSSQNNTSDRGRQSSFAPPQGDWNRYETEEPAQPPVDLNGGINLDTMSNSLSLNWKLKPRMLMNTPFQTDDWNRSEDIDWTVDFTERTSDLVGSLTLNFNALNQAITLTETQSYNYYDKEYLDLFDSIDEELSGAYLSKEQAYNGMNWNHSLNVNLFPFKQVTSLAGTSIKYNLSHKIYYQDWVDESLETEWFSYQDDMVSSQFVSANLSYSPFNILNLGGSYKFSFYPDSARNKQDWSASLNLSVNTFSQTIKQSGKWDEDAGWEPGSLTSSTSYRWNDLFSFSNTLTVDVEEKEVTRNDATLSLWIFDFSSKWNNGIVYNWDTNNYQWESETETFHWESLGVSASYSPELPLLWKNRIDQNLNTRLNWNMNLNKVNQNRLTFYLNYSLDINEFIDLSFTVNSENNSMFLYFKGFRDIMGIETERTLLGDLFNSFAFFSPGNQLRYDSLFNMEDISISATHYMGNWNAIIEYSGEPKIESGQTEWESTFSFIVHWVPIEFIQSKIAEDQEGVWSASSEWEE